MATPNPSATILVLLTCGMLLAGCGSRVPPVPESARGQVPRAAPLAPWQGRGRLELVVPGKRISCTAILRGLGNGTARAVFLSDEGVLLADLTANPFGFEVVKAIPDLADALPHLGRLVMQAYAGMPSEMRTWEDGRLVATAGKERRIYGGDPLLLREIDGAGLDLLLEDWCQLGGELLAHEVRGEGPFGITLRIHLEQATMKPLSADPAPRP
jgi:hypothetical protein